MYLDLIDYNENSSIIKIEVKNGYVEFFINNNLYQFVYLDNSNGTVFRSKLSNLQNAKYILLYIKEPYQKIKNMRVSCQILESK